MARLTIVQYAGDYREAVERFAVGGPETYRAQRYSVDLVGSLAERFDSVSVVCGLSDNAYDSDLANGVRAIGLGCSGQVDIGALIAAVARTRPTHLVVTTPQQRLLWWALRRRLPTLALFADSFNIKSWRSRLRSAMLALTLNNPTFRWVGNHGLNACLSLLTIGVRANKVIPWDWPSRHDPHTVAPRRRSALPLRLAYAGLVTEEKGVGDLLAATAQLRDSGIDVGLRIAGSDVDGAMQARAADLNITDRVEFMGLIANEAVGQLMTEADAVVVPSRHSYPEGLPLVIYEALAVRTPLIASDHPMFRGAIVDGESALIFSAGNVDSLAAAIRRMQDDHALYASLSDRAADAWQALQLPVAWGDLMTRWLDDDPTSQRWLTARTIASGLYDSRLMVRRAALAEGR